MSIVEDVRQIFQDFLAPELRAIGARMDAADKVAEARHAELVSKIQLVQTQLEGKIDSLISALN